MFGYEMSAYDKKVYEEQLKDFLPERLKYGKRRDYLHSGSSDL